MNKRRNFIRKAGLGLALGGLAPQTFGSISQTANSGKKVLRNNGETVEKQTFTVKAPLFCPYHSILDGHPNGGGSHYYRENAFSHNPFTIRASGMSGSPLIVDAEGKLIGFTTNLGFENSTFSFDGVNTLTVTVPPGQELYIDETGDGERAWKRYNSEMMERLGIQPLDNHPSFWSDVEYCTWVEQKYQSKAPRQHFRLLNHQFISDYLDKLIEFDYPKGKMTLDHGWGLFPDGSIDSGFGSWEPDPGLFPDFRKTMDMISEKGFTPGLWIGFPKIHAASTIAQKRPNLLGDWDVRGEKLGSSDVRYLNPSADIYEYASEVIGRFHEMGVRKFKIDMSYNRKSDMLFIHKELYRAAKNIDPTLEMEFHVPDIFFVKHCDTIRTNDIWLRDEYDWEGRVSSHYKVSTQSAPGRVINLDHIGGNDTSVITEKKFLRHLEMYEGKTGYPLVSVLPHHFGKKCVKKTGDYLWKYQRGGRKAVSDYYNA
ncbi:MAG: hypothetical protein JXR03_16555 [Cyclobacteriaceae bacterium]